MQATRGAPLTSSGHTEHASSSRRPGAVRLIFAVVALVALAVDVGTKQWAVSTLDERDIAVTDWLTLHLTFNPGAAFSTGTKFTVVFTALAIVAVIVVLWLSRRVRSRLWALALGLLLGGVAGNLSDRLFRDPAPFRGHVVDFLMLPNWPVFNVADICINVAAALIILQTFRGVSLNGSKDSA